MLVLSRKIDEAIIIGENIEIYIVDIKSKRVRLGINAPKSTPVHRKEIYLKIQGSSNSQNNPHTKNV